MMRLLEQFPSSAHYLLPSHTVSNKEQQGLKP